MERLGGLGETSVLTVVFLLTVSLFVLMGDLNQQDFYFFKKMISL